MAEKPKFIRSFERSIELDEECKSHGFGWMVAKVGDAYWATVYADRESAVVVMAASGGDLGKTSPAIALCEALSAAVDRKPELEGLGDE